MPNHENTANLTAFKVKTFGVSWPLLIALLVLFGVLGFKQFDKLLADPDTYMHITAGRWILDHGAVPLADPFSYSMPGAPWSAHEWLSELILLGAYHAGGWPGLVVLAALSFAGTLAYLTRFLLVRMEPAHALLLTAFSAGMLITHLLARPHVLMWPLLATWIGALVDAGERDGRPPWHLVPLMTLWANLHGSFTLGLALGAVLALDAVLGNPRAKRRAAAWRWGGFVGLATLAALFTPWGLDGFLYSLHVTNMGLVLDVFSEWRSPDFHRPQPLELWLLLVFFLACSGRLRLPWLRLLLLLCIVHLALKHVRHVSILGLVSPLLIAAPLAFHMRAQKIPGGDVESIDRLFRALALPAKRGALMLAGLLAALWIAYFLHSSTVTPLAEHTPAAAVQAAKAAGANDAVFHSQQFGGYLIYRGIPVFIDGRVDMYGDALLKRYLDAANLYETRSLPALLDDYHIGWTLLAPGTPAIALLDQLQEWRQVYADNVAVVHVRQNKVTGAPK